MSEVQRIIAIGDIHGCFTAFELLLAEIRPTANDILIPLGDYIDRGPESRRVIERLLELREQTSLIPILGNHEIMCLAARESKSELQFWKDCGGEETLDSYGGSIEDIPSAHYEFFEACRHFHETDRHFFVHANYEPHLPLAEQNEYTLFWKHLSLGIPPRHFSGKTAVVGHTPQRDGLILNAGHVICLDTACFGGGWLTALDVNSGRLWQANEEGTLRIPQPLI